MKKVIFPTLLAIGGVFIGWYGLINLQLYSSIHKLELVAVEQAKELDKITEYLQKTYGVETNK